jgi:hypothetical protein
MTDGYPQHAHTLDQLSEATVKFLCGLYFANCTSHTVTNVLVYDLQTAATSLTSLYSVPMIADQTWPRLWRHLSGVGFMVYQARELQTFPAECMVQVHREVKSMMERHAITDRVHPDIVQTVLQQYLNPSEEPWVRFIADGIIRYCRMTASEREKADRLKDLD